MPLARRRIPELMDDPALESSSHIAALKGLSRLNALASTDDNIWRLVSPVACKLRRPLRFLDVATGSGDLLRRLARRAARAKLSLDFTACDISSRALHWAQSAAAKSGLSLRTLQLDVLSAPLPTEFDIAHCGLFLHHLDPPQVEIVLKRMAAAAPVIIIQDLHRTVIGLSFAAAIPRLVTRSSIVHTDALISVRAAYTADEMRELAARAGLQGARVTPIWPQRLLLYWERPS